MNGVPEAIRMIRRVQTHPPRCYWLHRSEAEASSHWTELGWTGDCGRGTGVLGTDTLVEYIIADAMRCLPKCSDGQLTWKTSSVKKAGFVQKWMDLGTGAPGQVQLIIRTVQYSTVDR